MEEPRFAGNHSLILRHSTAGSGLRIKCGVQASAACCWCRKICCCRSPDDTQSSCSEFYIGVKGQPPAPRADTIGYLVRRITCRLLIRRPGSEGFPPGEAQESLLNTDYINVCWGLLTSVRNVLNVHGITALHCEVKSVCMRWWMNLPYVLYFTLNISVL